MPTIYRRGPSGLRRLGRRRYTKPVRRVRSKYVRQGSTETHRFKRFMRDVVLQNDYTAPNSDLNWEVDGTPYGKTYENFYLSALFGDTNGTSQIGGSMGFNMNMLPGLPDFSTLYDKYKLDYITINISPLSNFASASNLGTLPTIAYAYDQDDLSVPTGMEAIRQYGTCKIRRLDKPLTIKLKPKILINGSSGGFGAAGDLVTNPKYIDMTNSGVPHFGIKFWMNNILLGNTANVNSLFRFTAKYHFTCSATR